MHLSPNKIYRWEVRRVKAAKRIVALAVMLLFHACILNVLQSRSQVSGIVLRNLESEDFRRQECSDLLLTELLEEPSEERISLLTASMLMSQFSPTHLYRDSRPLQLYKAEEYGRMLDLYESVWSDVVCFPVTNTPVFYENSWMAPRSFGGERRHEGTDLFGEENLSGCYPILSMTDGVVENVGWLPLGGYRIGIRAPHGGYYYYAHLASYEWDFQPGDKISAGEILGYMGNTGYGEEGTSGKFPVHLHLGIYIETENNSELSVNPYWILRYVEGL